MQKITPFLWFESQAEEAMNFYTAVFPNSEPGQVVRYSQGGPLPAGTVLTASFTLEGLEFTALNGGPHDKFNDAISLSVDCETQAEVNYFWDKLSEGGKTVQCGWLKDRYGLSWQIVPSALPRMLSDPDVDKAGRVMQAMMKMVKIDIAELEVAYRG